MSGFKAGELTVIGEQTSLTKLRKDYVTDYWRRMYGSYSGGQLSRQRIGEAYQHYVDYSVWLTPIDDEESVP